MNKNYKPSAYQVLIAGIFLLQAVTLITTQTSIDPIDVELRENRALKLSTETPADDGGCPHCNIMSEMPMELADKINEINDLDVFIHDFVDDTNSLSNFSSITHPAGRRRRAASTSLKQATCKPVDTIVSLVPPNERDPTVFYYPSCILVKQCGGCCAHSGTSCSPLEETENQVTIKKTKFMGGSKLQPMGDVTVTVKEHTKCKCQCKKTASDCNSLQKFIGSQCRCECNNIAEAEQCGKDQTKLWDTNRCACVCRDQRECSTGFSFDQTTCSCQPYNDDDETSDVFDFGDHQFNETFEAADGAKYYTIPGN